MAGPLARSAAPSARLDRCAGLGVVHARGARHLGHPLPASDGAAAPARLRRVRRGHAPPDLARRRFPAGRFIGSAGQLDYLQEPDVFHDVFGHVPLPLHPVMADFMRAYGAGGLRAQRLGALELLARVDWYTVEFGLVREGGALAAAGPRRPAA